MHNPQPLSDRLAEYVRACFTALWIESHEHEDALADLASLCRREDWSLAVWDIEQGFHPIAVRRESLPAASGDPLEPVRAANSLATPEGTSLVVLLNFHRFLGSPEIVQAVSRQILAGKQQRTFLVVLSPLVELPPELERQFVILEHEPPDRDQLAALAESIATEPGELREDDLPAVLDAAAGLTRYEAEGAFSLSLVREGAVKPNALWELKAQTLKKHGPLRLHRGGERFAELGGLDSLKSFCTRALSNRSEDPAVRPRGVLLLGVSGSGKSQFAKALGAESGRPVLSLDVGQLMGSLVGETERNVRRALATADAMAPCVLYVDEVEKGLAGAEAGGRSDAGVASRLFGSLLTWLNDHTSDVFVVCTANDIQRLPPEFARSERFDAVFFLDLPDPQQRSTIWEIYRQRFSLEEQTLPSDEGWTGAEIRSCCRLAALLDVPLSEAAKHVVPVSATAGEAVQRLREWASGRCLSADQPGLYRCQPNRPTTRRTVSRNVSQN